MPPNLGLATPQLRALVEAAEEWTPETTIATGSGWPEPEPLRRTPEPGEPFPVEALGGVRAPAALAIQEIIKAPWRYVPSQC